MNPNKNFKYTPPEIAIKRVLEYIKPIEEVEEIPIDNAVNRVLAEDIVVYIDIPPYNTSHFDGYAARYEDTMEASYEKPVTLIVKGEVKPNMIVNYEVKAGEAYRINTGGYLPRGTNTVIPREAVKVIDENKIQVTRKSKPLEHVIKAGEDYKRGETIFKRGRIIEPKDLDLIAYMKIEKLKVYRKPVISILAVGDELIAEGGSPHTLMISNLIREFGGEPVDMGIAKDDINDISSKILDASMKSDLIVTIGGCSVGFMDLVADAILSIPNSQIIVRGIRRIPGRQTSFAIANGKPILMLPGLIQSMTIGFYTLGVPAIMKLSNVDANCKSMVIKVKVSRRVKVENMLPFERVLFGRIIELEDIPKVELLSGSSMLRRMIIESHGFIIIPPFKREVLDGEVLEMNLFKPINLQ